MTYGASPIKRFRRTQSDMVEIRQSIRQTLMEIKPATVRQLFYQLVSRGAIDKTEQAYKGIVCRLTAEMRRSGEIPYRWLADNTRWVRRPTTHYDLKDALESMQEFYRRDILAEQDVRVEIWCEKDALAGVIFEETEAYHVPLYVTRGYPSLTYIYEASEEIKEEGKRTIIYYLGDLDPSGIDIPKKVQSGLEEMGAVFEFVQLAVKPSQIEEFSLQTRPTKTTDSRAKGFIGESVELDAIPPRILRAMVRKAIEQHIDSERLRRTRLVEQQERETLASITALFGGAA